MPCSELRDSATWQTASGYLIPRGITWEVGGNRALGSLCELFYVCVWIVAFLWLLVLILLFHFIFTEQKKKKNGLLMLEGKKKKKRKKEDIWSVDSKSPSPCACYVGPTDESVSNFGPSDLEDGSWQISWGRFSRFNFPSSHFFMGEVEFGFSLNSGFSTCLFPWWFWLSNGDDQRVKSKKSSLFF